MNNRIPLILLLVFLFHSVRAQEAKEIVRKADQHSRGKTQQATLTIQTIRPAWTREMKIRTWGKGNDLALILVTAPAKEKGVVFLKRKKEVWNWIPSIERTIKMPPSMMAQSWMGTDFTNDDLVKEASILEDYDHSLLKDSTIEGRSCYKVRLIPKSGAAVVWGKILLWIDKQDYLMLHAEYYDEDGTLINRMHCSDVKLMGGRLLPARMEMVPAEKRGHKTVLIYTTMVFDEPLADDFFTVRNMTQAK